MKKEDTMRNNPSVESILNAASEQPWLTTEQEIELGNRIKSGDEDALKQLINGNIRFVVSLASIIKIEDEVLKDLSKPVTRDLN